MICQRAIRFRDSPVQIGFLRIELAPGATDMVHLEAVGRGDFTRLPTAFVRRTSRNCGRTFAPRTPAR